MLMAFRTENFRSIRDETELMMVVPGWVSTQGRVVREVRSGNSDRCGTIAAIYGPNASGKSNVIAALWTMANAVSQSHQTWAPDSGVPSYSPFVLDEAHPTAPTLFEVDLLLDGTRYRYGFRFDGTRIAAEWLYSFPKQRRRVLFERREDRFIFGNSLGGPVATIRELTRQNSLFLSAAAANNHGQLSRIASWFSSSLRFASPADQLIRIRFTADKLSDKALGPRIQELLAIADLGIKRAKKSQKQLPEEDRARLRRAVEALAPGQVTDDQFEEAIGPEVSFLHEGAGTSASFSIDRESTGTQTWFGLLGPIVQALANGYTLLIDELDSSLHAHVTAQMIRLFREPEINTNAAQLIFTTHDTSLLGNLVAANPVVHRDELWLTEKSAEGATVMYPLTDFRPRKHENLERGYLQGRYGAIPLVGDLSKLKQPVG